MHFLDFCSVLAVPKSNQCSYSLIMSLKGVRQMKELVIRYSDYDGSSKGIREWMRTNLVDFAKTNPDLTIKTELKRCVHPFLRGNYANGNSKTICVKNLQPEGITDYVMDLRNQIGRKVSFYAVRNRFVLLFIAIFVDMCTLVCISNCRIHLMDIQSLC